MGEAKVGRCGSHVNNQESLGFSTKSNREPLKVFQMRGGARFYFFTTHSGASQVAQW